MGRFLVGDGVITLLANVDFVGLPVAAGGTTSKELGDVGACVGMIEFIAVGLRVLLDLIRTAI